MDDAKFFKWLNTYLDSLEQELLGKTRSADLLELRYLSGQVHGLLIAKNTYLQIRREGENAEG